MSASYVLVSYKTARDAMPRAGVMRDNGVFALEDLSGIDLIDVVKDWGNWEERLRTLIIADDAIVEDAQLLAPLRYPSKLIMAGANYRDHIKEMNNVSVRDNLAPFFFSLPPTTTIIGPGEAIRLPADKLARTDWEAELAIVIGRPASGVSRETALEYVAGYTALNDVTARGWLFHDDAVASPFEWDWLSSKGYDTFCPLGPGIAPAFTIRDPQALRIRLTVNGVEKQNGNASSMVNGVANLVSALSEHMTLEPGDVIGTGTPAGVGHARGEQLHPGDVVAIEIPGIGRLENPVVAADTV